MNKEMQEVLDQIMMNTHELVDILVKKARLKATDSYTSTEETLDKIFIKNTRKKLIELYSDLSEYIDISEEEIVGVGEYTTSSVIMKKIEKAKAQLSIREEIDAYIETCYAKMQFIEQEFEGVKSNSIYEDTDQETMRILEYKTYARNLDYLEFEKGIRDKQVYELNFIEKSMILESIEEYKIATKSERFTEKVIQKIKSPDFKYEFRSEECKKETILDLNMYKVLEEFRKMNEEDNGVFSSLSDALIFINKDSEDGEIQTLLGISKEDYEGKVNHGVEEFIREEKRITIDLLRSTRKPKKKINLKNMISRNKTISNVFSKIGKTGSEK